MHVARGPTRRIVRHLFEDVVSDRALPTRRQAKDLHIRGQRPHVKRTKGRLGDASGIAAEMIEFVVHFQSDSLAARPFLKDQQITEQTFAISDRTARLVSSNSQ